LPRIGVIPTFRGGSRKGKQLHKQNYALWGLSSGIFRLNPYLKEMTLTWLEITEVHLSEDITLPNCQNEP
jgi:hypothetical protein